MKNYIFSTLVLFFIGNNAFGQSPGWTVNENDFQYTMSFVAFVNVDGNNLSSANDKVGAFVNGVCRGVSNLTYVASENSYYAYLTVFSNENSETVNFKIYDSTNNVVKDVEKTKTFEINAHNGNLFQSFSIASPALSSNADIVDFDFKDISENDKKVVGNQITVELDKSQNITALNAVFELSLGAELFIGTANQVSGENAINFTSPVQFKVRSQDQSVLKEWTVTVKLSTGTATFYKKDAVCYAGGVIKVVFTENEVEAVLLKNGLAYATQTIHNGVAVFNDLETGNYRVKVGGNNKDITINLKE